MSPALDPLPAALLRAGLALLLLAAARHKLRDPAAFRAALAGYGLLPEQWLGPAVLLFAGLELLLAALLALPGTGSAPALAAAGLLALYAGAMIAALAAGRRGIDCGCFGTGAGPAAALGPAQVARTGLFVAAALAAALPVAPRAWQWIDSLALVAALAALACLGVALEQALAQGPRLRALRRQGLARATRPAGAWVEPGTTESRPAGGPWRPV